MTEETKLDIPQVSQGDTVNVSFKIIEGGKERLQGFEGVVIKVRRGADGGNFTVRKVVSGIGVERTFPFLSPRIAKIDVLQHAKVRRAKLYYLRGLSTRKARLREKREEKTTAE
jgi:large subunit ribosomal protein L19